MIEAFFNLKKTPFQKNIDSDSIYLSAAGKELMERLEHMKRQRGMMLITGKPGIGKTTHIRAFIEKLNSNLFTHFYIPLATVHPLDFYRQLAERLGGEMKWQKSQLFSSIQNAIKNYVVNVKKIPLIVLDEIHLLRNENFHELQIITNFNIDSQDPAIVILVGQPHIKERLCSPVHLSFNQRISLKFNLTPLSETETAEYIQHHLELAGCREKIFNENAVNAIYKNSNGTLRTINSLAVKSMMLAASLKKSTITEEEVYLAAREL